MSKIQQLSQLTGKEISEDISFDKLLKIFKEIEIKYKGSSLIFNRSIIEDKKHAIFSCDYVPCTGYFLNDKYNQYKAVYQEPKLELFEPFISNYQTLDEQTEELKKAKEENKKRLIDYLIGYYTYHKIQDKVQFFDSVDDFYSSLEGQFETVKIEVLFDQSK